MPFAQMRSANYTAKVPIETFLIPDIEQHRNNHTKGNKPDWLWCSYTKGFVRFDNFSASQKLAIFNDRYCMHYHTPDATR